jgi:serine/threonine protein phosphatase 1
MQCSFAEDIAHPLINQTKTEQKRGIELKKLFVVSDIHGHATILKKALQDAGFDPQNTQHLLVCCGDCFDRGVENRAVLKYLRSIPNKVLIRGNHEDMLEQAMLRGSISALEVRNGTINTLEEFFGADSIDKMGKMQLNAAVKEELTKFIGEMVDYFETERYVFTHGWIPLHYEWGEYKMRSDWRTASLAAWESARFTGWNQTYEQKMTLPGKTIVCGHRSAHYGYQFDAQRSPHCHDPFYGKQMIAIDGLTIVSKQVNVLVLEDELLASHTHAMKLQKEHFDHIAEGSKTVEMRLFDEKRRKIHVGDTIEFTREGSEERKLLARVQGMYVYHGFDELVEDFTPVDLGFAKTSPGKIEEYMLRIYGVEKAFKNKALAIKVKAVDINEA